MEFLLLKTPYMILAGLLQLRSRNIGAGEAGGATATPGRFAAQKDAGLMRHLNVNDKNGVPWVASRSRTPTKLQYEPHVDILQHGMSTHR